MSFDLQSQTEYEMYACRFGGVFVYDVVLCLHLYRRMAIKDSESAFSQCIKQYRYIDCSYYV